MKRFIYAWYHYRMEYDYAYLLAERALAGESFKKLSEESGASIEKLDYIFRAITDHLNGKDNVRWACV